jgi:DNA-binding NtrC family response regulator
MAVRLLIASQHMPPQVCDDDLGGADLTVSYIGWHTLRSAPARQHDADVLVIDARDTRGDVGPAVDLLRWMDGQSFASPTLAVLPAEPDHDLLRATAAAVDDFVLAPVRRAEWRERVARLTGSPLESHDSATPRDRLMETMALTKLVGQAPSFLRTVNMIPLAARSRRPVLITGETGTGKELCARAVHHLGPRGREPFIPVDCGAFPDHLIENELFGHVRGAFTDARTDQRGLVSMADGGTLFLDEIDALAPPAQSKLLRFLQERTFKPLGADRFVLADVNVLAATNRDLRALVREGKFRADLYFRINVLSLHLAPLRLRRPDIPLLAWHFVRTSCAEHQLPAKTLSPGALRALSIYDWPGNVRELYNVIQRALVFCEGPHILRSHIELTPPAADEQEERLQTFRQARARAIAAFERDFIEELLRRHDGNVTKAAREAQKERRAFGRLVKKYGLTRQAS